MVIKLSIALAIASLVVGCISHNTGATRSIIAVKPYPIDDWVGVPKLSKSASIYFAGQPTQEGLKALSDRGVKIVVNLRSVKEMQTAVDFDEAVFVKELGMKYVHIPMTPSTFSSKDVARLKEVLDLASIGTNKQSRILIHCASSNRVGAMWAAYLNRELGFDSDKAIEYGKNAGLRSDSMIEAAKRVIAKTSIK